MTEYFLWQRPPGTSDAGILHKAVDVMGATAEVLENPNGCEDIEVPLHVGCVMMDLMNSAAEAILDIANALYREQGGNVQPCTCKCQGEEEAE